MELVSQPFGFDTGYVWCFSTEKTPFHRIAEFSGSCHQWRMIGLFTTVVFVVATQRVSGETCIYDRAAMLALDQKRFDQDMNGGWRKLANNGCDLEGADLIKDWRDTHASQDGILYWHEGQLRANGGQRQLAISLFERSRKTPVEDAGFGWNLYVDGTIAFLRRDRSGLKAARNQLAQLPRPKNFSPKGPDGKPISIGWPLNLNVLDGFATCWRQPYKKAYSCAKPMFKYSTPPAAADGRKS